MTKQEARWVKLLEKAGYKWAFRKFEQLGKEVDVLFAIKGRKKFPITLIYGHVSVIRQDVLAASLANLNLLVNDADVKVIWRNNHTVASLKEKANDEDWEVQAW